MEIVKKKKSVVAGCGGRKGWIHRAQRIFRTVKLLHVIYHDEYILYIFPNL